MSYILTLDTPLHELTPYGGGKAINLHRMESLEIPVPPWFCLSVEAFDAFVESNKLADALIPTHDLAAFSQRVDQLFQQHPIPVVVQEAVCNALEKLNLHESFVAVRSSGLDEDSAGHSFAGQFSSFLYQKGIDSIAASIKRCWASGYSERALSYRKEKGLNLKEIRVAVIIQKMVDARCSGVAFSKNPVSPLDKDHVIVDAVYGLGEGLVSGLLDADHHTIHRLSREIKSTIAQKTHALRQAHEGGLRQVDVPDEQREVSALTDQQVQDVASLAIKLEEALGKPQDCEWAIDAENELVALQTRPITNLPSTAYYDATINGIEPILWDNSNIVESYSGVTSPLTFSFASNAYRQVYVQFCEIMGVPESMIAAHEAMYRNMLGSIRGHVYYNLANWYRLVHMLPGLGSNAAFMETMMGVKQSLDKDAAALFDFMEQPPGYSFLKKAKVTSSTLLRFIRMPTILSSFWAQFNRIYAESRQLDFRSMSLPSLMAHYQYLNEEILRKWHAPIINDYLCMIFFGLLKKLTESWITGSDSVDSLQNDLLCGEGDLESTEPTKFLMRIASAIDQGEPAFRSWFLSSEAETLWQALPTQPGGEQTYNDITVFLDKYGFRCVNELKLEEPDLHEDPTFLIHSIAGYIKTGSYDIQAMEKREKEIRQKAERIVAKKIRGPRRLFYNWVLKQARVAVKNRENLRFGRTRIFGICRHLFRAAGYQLERLEVLETEADVFYLTVDELIGYVEGRPTTIRLDQLVALRKEEYEAYRNTPPPPERFITYGAVGYSNGMPTLLADTDLLKETAQESTDPNVLKGTPCCPGIVEGVVRVVMHPSDARGLENEILVTARTDPGWVPLFPACSGLLIERGSLLSHSAVVARELGLPTIVGISGGLMKKLKTGQRVKMDATRGEIYIIEEK